MKLLVESQYFGPVSTYLNLNDGTHIDFCISESFRKMSFRNRCILPGANGLINLTVPIEGGREQKKSMQDIKIDYKTNWQKIHWRTIFSVYGNSPWFEFLSTELESIYQLEHKYLLDWNLVCFDWSIKKIGIEIKQVSGQSDNEIINRDLRNRILPSNFQEPVNGPFPEYAQVFRDKTGFQANMSILDLICCEGKRAGQILRENAHI